MSARPRLLDLPHGYQTIIDEDDWPLVRMLALYRGSNGYAYFSVWHDGRSHPQVLHRLLTDAPKGTHVDHVNGDKLDNRQCNLRIVSPSLNQVNRKRLSRNNRSGIRGVSFQPSLSKVRPWRAQITVERRGVHLGLFASAEEAIAARRAAEIELFGEMCP